MNVFTRKSFVLASAVMIMTVSQQSFASNMLSLKGALTSTSNETTLNTINDKYVLVDEHQVLNKAKGYQKDSKFQCFRVCVEGELVEERLVSQDRFRKVFKVKQLCHNK